MDMKHRLANCPAIIGYDTKIFQAQICGNFGRRNLHLAQHCCIVIRCGTQPHYMPLRNHENVCRRNGMQIFEGEYVFVFKNRLCRNFTGNNFAENTVG